MNMQALMKQAQKMQKDMMSAKEEIDNTEFIGENGIVKVTVKGTKEIVNVQIKNDCTLEKEDIEMLEDMILLAINQANKKVDESTENKMGKFGNSMPGLF